MEFRYFNQLIWHDSRITHPSLFVIQVIFSTLGSENEIYLLHAFSGRSDWLYPPFSITSFSDINELSPVIFIFEQLKQYINKKWSLKICIVLKRSLNVIRIEPFSQCVLFRFRSFIFWSTWHALISSLNRVNCEIQSSQSESIDRKSDEAADIFAEFLECISTESQTKFSLLDYININIRLALVLRMQLYYSDSHIGI